MSGPGKRSPRIPGDSIPTTGRAAPSARLEKLRKTGHLRTGDELADRILTLLDAHPDIHLRFRNTSDVKNLEEEAKKRLLADIYEILEIEVNDI